MLQLVAGIMYPEWIRNWEIYEKELSADLSAVSPLLATAGRVEHASVRTYSFRSVQIILCGFNSITVLFVDSRYTVTSNEYTAKLIELGLVDKTSQLVGTNQQRSPQKNLAW